MATIAETSTASIPVARATGTRALVWQGTRAGLIGAAVIAVWFLFLDYGRDRLFYTPTLLGSQLVGSGGVLHPAVTFSIVHALVFIVLGIVAARLFAMLEEGGVRRWGLAAFLLFLILDLGFSVFALSARAVHLEALSWTDVLLGNALAATAMVASLWRARPHE